MKKYIYFIIEKSKLIRKIIHLLFPSNIYVNELILKETYLHDYIYNHYPKESLNKQLFYNIGAGNQRSKFKFWSYIDMEDSKYDKKGIDIFYDLESLKPIPLAENTAEVIFNSFVIEHISIQATKNLCKEAYRILKKGGVFHSKVHSYEYGYRLLQKNIISPKFPFNIRESSEIINQFIKKHRGRVNAYFNESNEYIIESLRTPTENISFSAADAFIFHNATSAMTTIKKQDKTSDEILRDINKENISVFYKEIKDNFINPDTRLPHQHSADYFAKEKLFSFIKELGFSEVYFTQPYQSISPALWEDKLNPVHNGFTFSIEAIK